MDGAQLKSILLATFPSKSKADRASRSLKEVGIPNDQISVYTRKQNDAGEFRTAPELQRLSEDQFIRYEQDLENGRSILSVVVDEDPEASIVLLGEKGAIEVDTVYSGRTMPLYEEQLVVSKETQEIGDIVIRKVIEEVQTQAEVDAIHQELDIEHVSVGEVVQQRREPWREGNVLVVPVYEEQLTIVRQLVMREQLRISLHEVTEKHVLTDTLKREHAVVEDPAETGRVRVKRRGIEPADDASAESAGEHGS